jgi:hypothetical protein
MGCSVFPALKSQKLKRIRKRQRMKWNGMKSIVPSAMNQILIRDIETKYFLNFIMETFSNKYLLTASEILWSENSDIKLNSNCDSNNWIGNQNENETKVCTWSGSKPHFVLRSHAPFYWATITRKFWRHNSLVKTISGFTVIYFRLLMLIIVFSNSIEFTLSGISWFSFTYGWIWREWNSKWISGLWLRYSDDARLFEREEWYFERSSCIAR